MELTEKQTIKYVGILLLLIAISQPLMTALYIGVPGFDGRMIWGLEGLIFVLLAAFAGSALVMAKNYTLGFSAIAFSAVLNVVQVGIGLTQFGPFREASEANAALGDVAGAVVAFSFFSYNAAKILLAMAAVVFGMGMIGKGKKLFGRAAVTIGAIAFVANAIVLMFGLKGFLPSPVAGGSGVLATFLLAFCLLSISKEE